MRVASLGVVARRRAIAAAAAAVIVLAALVLLLTRSGPAAPVAPATARVQRGTVTLAVAAAGTVTSSQTRGLSFSVAGTVTEVDVKAGDPVTAGQVLARIDPADAQSAVDAAASRVDDAQDAVDRAETSAAQPACSTGAARAVAYNQPLTTMATTPPPATPTPTGSRMPTAPATTPGRTTTTTAPGGGQQTCAASGRGSGDSLLQAQQQLNNALLALQQAKARLAGTTITAPVAGRVLSVGGKVGSRANPGGTGFVVLGQVASLTVKAQVSEADVGRLSVGQTSAITLPDRPDPLAGTVSSIDPAGTVVSRLVRFGVVIAFDTTPPDLLLGQSANVVVTTASAADALYVSSAAVSGIAGEHGSVVLRAGGRDERRPVVIGLRGDQYTQITDGLAEGDEVVLPSSP